MLGENIKRYRKQQKLSQEELAIRLHVVRQTVSKWEKDLSVPDAALLIELSKALGVSVGELLDQPPQDDTNDLVKRLAELNEQLAQTQQQQKLAERANRLRGLILLLTFVLMLVIMAVKQELVSILLAGGCMLAVLGILYRNLALLTSVTTDDLRLGVLKRTTVFNGILLITVIGVSAWMAVDRMRFSEQTEKGISLALICAVMVFVGLVAPKLPFNRHTGLRLPWTVQDEQTWHLAHKILGVISLPIALLYLAAALTLEHFEVVSACAVLLWIGIPSAASLVFYQRKYHGKQ